MERVRRRFWTWGISILAVLMILAGSISGIFQLAVMALPDYRDDLSIWVTKVAGRPVQIGGINLVWRGFSPRLDLSDITLYTEDGEEEALTAERLSLGFSLPRLLTRDYSPQSVVLSGLSLGVKIDADGQISVAGFEKPAGSQPLDLHKWLTQAEQFGSVRLERCTVNLDDERPGKQTQLRFALNALELDLDHDGFDVEGVLKLPAAYGDTLSFESSVDGPLPEPEKWGGDFSVHATGLMPQPWLRGRVAPGTRVAAEDVVADVSGKLGEGKLSSIEAKLESGILLATRAGRSVQVQSMKARAQLQREGNGGWLFKLGRFQLDGDNQLEAEAHYLPAADGSYQLDAEASTLRLDHLLPWLQYARELPPALTRAADGSGQISDLVLRLHHSGDATQYSLRAGLKGVALKSDGESVGVSGIGGELSANENGGQLRLDGPPQLQLPKVLEPGLDFEQLNGQLEWRRVPDGWQLTVPQLDWRLAGTSGRGKLGLLLPSDAQRSPEIQLNATFAAADLMPLKVYMPKTWNGGLKDWLDRAILAGRVPRAQLNIDGPLADFPFVDKDSGQWKLDIDVSGGRLAYAPHWPDAEDLHAKLHFHGNGLNIEADSATLHGLPAESVSARFEDFRDHHLYIDGSIAGETSDFYDFLRDSPLRETLAGLVKHTSASGPSRVKLHLDIPLQETAKTEASGTVALDGVQLNYASLADPIKEIRGEIAFNNSGISAQQLSASFQDLALAARVEPRAQTHGVVVAEFPYAIKADGSGASGYIPELLRNTMAGESRWRAELPLGADSTELSLSTDLRGVAVNLPKPLGKAADEAAPLRVTVGGSGVAGDPATHVRVNYDNRLGADVALAQGANATGDASGRSDAGVRGVSLRLGAGTPLPPQEGMLLTGETADIDLFAWIAALGSPRDAQSPTAATVSSKSLSLRSANVHADRLFVSSSQFVRDARVTYNLGKDGWNARLTGSGGEGEALWTNPDGGHLAINLARANLERLPPPPTAEAGKDKTPPGKASNPNDWPVLELTCAQCQLDGADFGQVKLNSQRIPGGQRLDYLTVEHGKLEASASGEWLRVNNQSSGKLKFDLMSPDFTTVLKSFGYAQNLSAKSSKLSGDVVWQPDAAGLAWEQSRGKITLAFDNGTLKSVDPGGTGRVLGLLNFYALPRRLLLDFRDVTKSGLAFDKIKGSFDLADGVATTNDMEIDGTLRMELRGKVGLAARDYDQRVTVYPDVTTGITLGATLLGGPALGALAFLAQEVLDKPIEQATHLTYQVTGSWDNPEVKRVEGGDKSDKSDKPGEKPADKPAEAGKPAPAPANTKRR